MLHSLLSFFVRFSRDLGVSRHLPFDTITDTQYNNLLRTQGFVSVNASYCRQRCRYTVCDLIAMMLPNVLLIVYYEVLCPHSCPTALQ